MDIKLIRLAIAAEFNQGDILYCCSSERGKFPRYHFDVNTMDNEKRWDSWTL
jgi:hypothetical protein